MDSSRVHTLKAKLTKHEQCIKSSKLFSHTLSLLQPLQFECIRCLALGSATSEFQALYQLAYLNLIVDEFSIPHDKVSLYDPAFTADDTAFLEEELLFKVESSEQFNKHSSMEISTLYYMPHAPRSLTEEILKSETPTLLLANDLSVTSGTLTKSKFFEGFPVLATLVHVWEKQQKDMKSENGRNDKNKAEGSNGAESDGFTPVVNNRRRNRAKKNVFVEPELQYDTSSMYFESVEIVRLKSDPDAAWKDSFSDLALNLVFKKKMAS